MYFPGVSCTVTQTVLHAIVECQSNNGILFSMCMIDGGDRTFNCSKFLNQWWHS